MLEERTDRWAKLTDRAPVEGRALEPGEGMALNLFTTNLERLQGVSSAYRDLYMVMVDVVRQSLPK